ELQVGQDRGGTTESDVHAARLARHSDHAALVLNDAVEEHAEESAVHQSGRALEYDGEIDCAMRLFVVDELERVLGEDVVERPDVGGMVQVDPLTVSLGVADAR